MVSSPAPASRGPEPALPEGAPDALYATRRDSGQFHFDAKVARVFQDMVERSVPGYASLVHGISVLGEKYAQPNATCYDLGCSLGTVARALAARLAAHHPIQAVDSSPDMIAHGSRMPGFPVQYRCADIRSMTLEPADVVILNLTLQFLPSADRLPLLQKTARALCPGGALILTEKIRFDEPVESLMQKRHESFKRARGYSELEISRKRSALEKVMIRDPLETHLERLAGAGFSSVAVWFQCLHFTSMLALR